MTDQTVSIPVELLQELKQTMPISSIVSTHVVGKIVSYIPTPLKVGDTLTEAQIRALPRKAVVRDEDDDIWISDGKGTVSLVGLNYNTGRPENHGGLAEDLAEYHPVLVSLPSE